MIVRDGPPTLGAVGRRRAPLPRGWGRLRREALERDGWRCRRCGGPAQEVDHVVPAHLGGTDDPSNLAAVCRRCHASKTAKEARARRVERRRSPEPHPGLATFSPSAFCGLRSSWALR
ncbi:MAG TPA: HNH endonuclease signature motif containing protein [Actinomycetota bacterium]|nr:HNH endonuclease signature motif containing protein [Actinomycetota bacterium]